MPPRLFSRPKAVQSARSAPSYTIYGTSNKLTFPQTIAAADHLRITNPLTSSSWEITMTVKRDNGTNWAAATAGTTCHLLAIGGSVPAANTSWAYVYYAGSGEGPGFINFEVYSSNGATRQTKSSIALTDGATHVIKFKSTPSQNWIFIDGVDRTGTTSGSGSTGIVSQPAYIEIGGYPSGSTQGLRGTLSALTVTNL